MKEIRLEKVTVNMGIGPHPEEMKKAKKILEQITGSKPIETKAKVRLPTWGIRPGLPIGLKVTLRKDKAKDFLTLALKAKDNKLSRKNFDNLGNFGFGIREHIDLPGIKYDPKLGIKGFDVLVTLERKGYSVKRRKIKKSKIGRKHLITKDEAIEYMKKEFGVDVE